MEEECQAIHHNESAEIGAICGYVFSLAGDGSGATGLMRTGRRIRSSVVASFGVAAGAFPVVGLLTGLIVFGLVRAVLQGLDLKIPPDMAFLGVLLAFVLGIPLLVVCVISRAIYLGMRWRTVDSEFGYCSRCGYDLTGNVSGVCPECGTGIHEK